MRRTNSSGFTLVEILVVIVLIAILVALLLPAIGAAVRSAKNAAVSSEENQLAQALADFRSRYGTYPHSRIIINENGDYSDRALSYSTYGYQTANSSDVNNGILAQRSVAALRRCFPRLELSTIGPTRGPGSAAYLGGDTTWFDCNGNGKMDGPVVLTGDECLVFFLGGVPSVSTSGGVTTWGMTGLSKNPKNPFQTAAVAPSRLPAMFDFRPDRLLDIDNDAYPSYTDSLSTGKPYAYFSGYEGTGMDPNDCNWDAGGTMPASFVESDEAGTTSPITLKFRSSQPTSLASSGVYFSVSPPPNPYCASASVASPVTWINGLSFQIISAGGDGLYGIGGQYLPQSDTTLPVDPANTTPSTDALVRVREKDNVTSFATGKLD
jgi:prepilin-type N-terminal cleavage/methylation domain-containing protein